VARRRSGKKVETCKANYLSSTVPDKVVRLVAAVDVQKNRLVYVVRGFGEGLESWQVERGELWGETDKADVWRQLEDLLETEWDDKMIAKVAIDSGYRPEPVYAFCRKHRTVAIAVKGHDSLDKPYYASTIDVTIRGKTFKGGLQLWHYSADIMKSWVHSQIAWDEENGEACTWHLPSDVDEDYCKQIVAEQRAQKPSGKVIWIQTAKDNHFLDCEALAYMAIRVAGGVGAVTKRKPKPKTAEEKEVQQSKQFVRRSRSRGNKGSWMRRR